MLSQNDFELLLAYSPIALAKVIELGSLTNTELTFAAEILGRAEPQFSDIVRWTLLPLLRHPASVVREGAIYGVTRHQNEEIKEVLREISKTDPLECLQEAARDALEEL